jgi:hypothetical protein
LIDPLSEPIQLDPTGYVVDPSAWSGISVAQGGSSPSHRSVAGNPRATVELFRLGELAYTFEAGHR